MRMGRFEKWGVNSRRHAERAVASAGRLLHFVTAEEGQDYLEVGCGIGATAGYMAKELHLNVVGVDVDAEQIRLAKENAGTLQHLHLLEADATRLPFHDRSFDIVLSQQAMHHISDWQAALKEVDRVLRPGGYFIYHDIVYPNWSARIWSSRIAGSFARNYGFPTIDGLGSFAAQNGFSALHSSVSNRHLVIFNQFEAVYRKGD